MAKNTPASTDLSGSTLMMPADSTSAEHLAKLWEHAVDDYEKGARLSDKEMAAIRQHKKPENIFDLTELGWEKNIADKQWRQSETVVRTVSQVLGVLGLVSTSLGFASQVLLLQAKVNDRLGISLRFYSLWGSTSVAAGTLRPSTFNLDRQKSLDGI
jgi:hypothetical protein